MTNEENKKQDIRIAGNLEELALAIIQKPEQERIISVAFPIVQVYRPIKLFESKTIYAPAGEMILTIKSRKRAENCPWRTSSTDWVNVDFKLGKNCKIFQNYEELSYCQSTGAYRELRDYNLQLLTFQERDTKPEEDILKKWRVIDPEHRHLDMFNSQFYETHSNEFKNIVEEELNRRKSEVQIYQSLKEAVKI